MPRVLHGAHSRAPETISQNPHGEDGAHKIRDAFARARVEQLRKGEEEDKRKQIIEEQADRSRRVSRMLLLKSAMYDLIPEDSFRSVR